MLELIDARFPATAGARPPRPSVGAERAAAASSSCSRDTEQTHVVIGVRALAALDPDRYALTVVNQVLGGGMSSRLFQEIRETRGLAYSVFSYRASFDDAGYLAIYAGTAPERVPETLEVIERRARPARRTSGLSDAELAAAKGHLVGSLAMSLETSASRMRRLGRSELVEGEIPSLDELIARVEAVTADDVARVVDRVFADAPRTLAVVGPHSDGGDLGALRRRRRSYAHDRMIRVGVFGAGGRMGSTVCRAVREAPDMELVAAVDPVHAGTASGAVRLAAEAHQLEVAGAQVAVDFTVLDAARENIRWCAAHGVHAVVGTTGFTDAELAEFAELFERSTANAVIVPNFAIGAVLMMRFAEMAAPFFETAEIIELHHDQKIDAPSGTAALHRAADRGRVEGLGRRPDHDRRGRGRSGRPDRRDPRALGADAGHGGAPGGAARHDGPDPVDPPRLLRPGVVHARRAARGTQGRRHARADDRPRRAPRPVNLLGSAPASRSSFRSFRGNDGGVVVGRGRAGRVRRHRRARRPVVHDRRRPDLRARSDPNGAGKTTLFNCVSRLYHPTSGAIRFDGHDLLRMPAHRIARVGIARTFQNLALFPALTRARQRAGRRLHARSRRTRSAGPKRTRSWSGSSLDDLAARPAVGLPYGTLEADRDRARARGAARGCCCSTSPRPVSPTPRSTSSAS